MHTLSLTAGSTRTFAHVEGVKWLALALMVADHVNAFLFGGRYVVVYLLGRLVFPLFAFALAYGFVQLPKYGQREVLRRLLLLGAIAQIPWLGFDHSDLFNVMGTLCGGAMIWHAAKHGTPLVRVAFVVAGLALGAASEYQIPGALMVAAICWWTARPGTLPGLAVCLTILGLWPLNGTWFALLALPLWTASTWFPEVPRIRGFFYKAYAGQWAVLWGVKAWLS